MTARGFRPSALIVLVAAGLAGCSPSAPTAGGTTTIVVPSPSGLVTTDEAGDSASPAPTASPTLTPEGGVRRAAPAPAPVPASSSVEVLALQKALGEHGYPVPVTGVRDAATVEAVRRVQRDHGLEPDGVAGPAFWGALVGAGSAAADPSETATPTAEPTTTTPAPVRSVASEPTAAPSTAGCPALYDEWVAAVRDNSRSRSQDVHQRAAEAGCRPNTWLPPGTSPTYDTAAAHTAGQSCAMAQIGTYDGAGLVCTQDVEGSPHWN